MHVYLKSPELNVDRHIDWRIGNEDGCRQREEHERKPDDEDEQKQQQSSHAILHNSSPLDSTLQPKPLLAHNDNNMIGLSNSRITNKLRQKHISRWG